MLPYLIAIGITLCLLGLAFLLGLVLVLRDTLRRKGKWGINVNAVMCPRCGENLSKMRGPKNANQTLWGGYTCAKCGCEIDKWGIEIIRDKP